jgi:aryl-alcohol dehydrogenase-like predicted oxidoreductase
VGVILGGPLQRKLATPHPEWLDHPPDWMEEDTRVRFRKLYDIQRNTGLTLAELGLRYLLADADVTTIIPGSSNVEHLEDNVRYALAGPLPAEIRERIERLGKVFSGLWGIDF